MRGKLHLVRNGDVPQIDLDRLAGLGTAQLRALHQKVLGWDLRSGNSEQARRNIAWHLQAEQQGGLPESAREHALAIARESSSRIKLGQRDPNTPIPNATVSEFISSHDSRVP